MTKTTRLAALAAAIALASAVVYAQQFDLFGPDTPPAPPAPSPDLVSAPVSMAEPGLRVEAASNLPNDYGVTHDQVGDADSFGRPLKWLGIHFMQVAFQASCPRANARPDEICQPIVDVNAPTSFTLWSTTSIELPPQAAQSLICQWVSPVQSVNFQNNTSARRYGIFRTTPMVVIYSDVLNDDSSTSGPSAGITPAVPWSSGKWVMQMASHYNNMTRPLEPGVVYNESSRNSQLCLSGIVNRRTLIEAYGMSETMADELFRRPMRLQFGVTGLTQNVYSAYLTMGTRVVGD
ncbi:hypothetical protein [Lysobacter brunescens]|uniref:Uncharacterized protein n=1 Tax=Lysobacter brunescens TaxID=262323 RepID=A0ABW2Y8U7_9GAMM